jgi:two-component system chemotaxis response regulator CheY
MAQQKKLTGGQNMSFTSLEQNIALLAEDDAYVRRVVRNSLKNFCRVVEAADGGDVLDLYRMWRPSFCILDIHLPSRDGIYLLKEIMGIDPDAYILIMSGDSSEHHVKTAAELGSKGFMCKPFNHQRLMNHLLECPSISFHDRAV